MSIQINRTPDGMREYPLHKHKTYEIMHYLEGQGNLRTIRGNIPFQPGSILIVPPGIEHGSTSDKGFINISISGDFEHLLYFDSTISLSDNDSKEGTILAKLIYDNRYGNENYLSVLCNAYVHFILQNCKKEDQLQNQLKEVVMTISDNAFDPHIDLTQILIQTGYSEDYIRSKFKQYTGKTPNAFLTDVRIRRACFLIDIYGDSQPLTQIAERCGYLDYVYFSKKFKTVTGISPAAYRNQTDT